MNRVVSLDLDKVSAKTLPPREPSGRARVLFLSNDILGWRTFATSLVDYTAQREDIDAVHILLQDRLPFRMRSLSHPRAMGRLQPHYRRTMVLRNRLHRWLTGPLPLTHFDVVHVAPHLPALAVAEMKPRWRGKLSIAADATVLEAKSQRGQRSHEEVAHQFAPMIKAEARILGAADIIWSMSTWTAEAIQYEHGIAIERIERLPPTPASPLPILPAASRDGDHSVVRLAFVGNDWSRKGGPRLLRWHQERWADRAELHVFSRSPRPAGQFRNLIWHGAMENTELLERWLPRMDVFVLPTYSDFSPFAVMEAVSAGLPVVSSAIGGLADLVVVGKTGYLIPVDDDDGYIQAVERLIECPTTRSEMGLAAQRHAAEYLDPQRHLGRLIDRLVELADVARR